MSRTDRTLLLAPLALAFLALGAPSAAAPIPAVPVPTIAQPPDRFFQEGSVLDVVAEWQGGERVSTQRGVRIEIQLLMDGDVVEVRTLPFDARPSRFRVPLDPNDPVGLIQVCLRQTRPRLEGRACAKARSAAAGDFNRVRQTLEEMNTISDAVVRYSALRLGFGHVPTTLAELVPDFLDRVPSVSPLATPYDYTGADGHFALRVALPGSGEIRNEDGVFTKLPRGAITDREAARVTRQQLSELGLSLESYRVDWNVFPERIEELAPVYRHFPLLVDPYGRPYEYSLAPDAYVLTSFGRDGLPGGAGFDADTLVTPGPQLAETTPYRGRYEYLRRTSQDLSQIAAALAHFHEYNGRWPDALDELVGGPWFSWPRPFTDFCGNPYDYQVFDGGFGNHVYRLRAFGCEGVPDTDSLESLLYFSADEAGHVTAPRGSAFLWPGLFD